MEHFLGACLFLMALMCMAKGQSCGSSLPSQCYYTGAGTISAGRSDNQYFAIGGLFDIREKGTDSYCSDRISPKGMLNLLAFYWSIDYYSNAKLKGKQMDVGAIAFDNCMRPDQSVENVLSFSQCKIQVPGLGQQNVVAYVGPYSDEDAYRTGMLAQDLKIPLISPSASSLSLDRKYQNTLLRMRPSMEYDLKAIAAFMKALNHKYLMIVYSSSSHWTMAYKKMMSIISTMPDMCNNFAASVEMDASDDDINELADNLLDRKSAKYVVLLMSKEEATKIITKTGTSTLNYILTSSIGLDSLAESVVVVEQRPKANMADFMTYLNRVKSNASQFANLQRPDVTNPWLNDFIAQNGFGQLSMDSMSPAMMDASRTIQSVEYIIDGLDQGINAICASSGSRNYQFCDQLRNLPGHEEQIYTYIRGLNFGTDGKLKPADVDYNYYYYKNSVFSNIGTFNGETSMASLSVQLKDVAQYGQTFTGSDCPSANPEECCPPPTTIPPPTTPVTAPITREPMTLGPDKFAMVKYPKGKEITGAFSLTDRLDDDYGTRFDIDQKWIIALGALAGLGILCVLVFEIFILYKMIGSHMGNKWRTMWLGQLLLFGIFLSYLVCFAYLFIPTKATCGITRFGVGVAYAIIFAVLLVKLMVILTSKTSDALLPGDGESPNYLKGVYQFLMFTFAVGIQIVINVQWLITVPPDAIQVKSSVGMVWVCNHYTWDTDKDMIYMDDFVRTNFENHLLSLTYIMVMILVITILSLNAHGIITNHRESVFIGIASGFSIPLWLAWGLVGGLNKDKAYGHEFGDACIAFGLFLTATLIMFSMFLPKVRQLVNMGVEGIYLEDDRDTIYGGGSVIMAPPSYKSKGAPSSIIYVNNQGIYSEPVVVGNGDMATHLRHAGSTYSAPPMNLRKTESTYGSSRVLRVTDDLKGRHPSYKMRKPVSEMAYGTSGHPRSLKGTLPRSSSQSDLGAL